MKPVLSLILILLISGCSAETSCGGNDLNVANGKGEVEITKSHQEKAEIISGDEPPINRFLADSPWPMSHRNSYCQASSGYTGPSSPDGYEVDFKSGFPGLITMAISGTYPDGKRVVWGSDLRRVFKLDINGRKISSIDYYRKESSGSGYGLVERATSGAYTLVDRDGVFFVPGFTRIMAFTDEISGKADSDIVLKGTYTIPQERLHGKSDKIVGINLTYDGMIVFATSGGTIAAVTRSFDRAYYIYLGEEEISNSIACDENGGVYVVTSRKMYRVQWTGSELTLDEKSGAWSAEYETGSGQSGIRLGAGSGSTPTVMGTGGQDKFVVITDGQDLMHLVIFWRDAIPSDWKGIRGAKDRRIAAQVPVRFGDPNAVFSISEQSVCVRGYGALVVNNYLRSDSGSKFGNILLSGVSSIAPYGAEKFEWDPASRTMRSVWVNTGVSLPNGIPCMSSATGLVYGIGKRGKYWTMEALDWNTGESVFYIPVGAGPWYNSAYAAIEIGDAGNMFTGTALGMVRLSPDKR